MNMKDRLFTVITRFLKQLTRFTYCTPEYVILHRRIMTPQDTYYTKSAERIKLLKIYIFKKQNRCKGANCPFHSLWNHRNFELNVNSDKNHYEESADS
ncbi:hypothetical protein C922_05769 [Plasmodium inui San Antonio 1]|uniref:Uncharacterized protein n=1 Tax=Plasmodium inui San Antonio 1 TaxID=1237626 RepID=W6ZX22_9APIC|nr:hypothetical protein C922_05769 [Plasmodium inui San Antonio 1]EUD63848.1 hypothetical protein C922_05769 [Plasmodium inui San Antonio 1]